MKSVARHFGEPLVVPGMKRSYGIVGDSLDGITDGIRCEGTISGCTSDATRQLASLVVAR